jgi:hypothetical protein
MTDKTDVKALVKMLKSVDHMSVEDCFLQSSLFAAAADALTTLSAENTRLAERVKVLDMALDLALEYWAHKQQRYKNRHPAWVQAAHAARNGGQSDEE